MPELYIDVSKYNSFNDYAKAASAVKGVIIRAGYRSYSAGKLMEDPLFQTHYKGFVGKVPYLGVYFFTNAISVNETRQEADYCMSLINGKNINLPVFVDSEYSNNNHNGRADHISRELRTTLVNAFCDRMREGGYEAGIYASDAWFVDRLDYNKLPKENHLWVASYSKAPYRVHRYDGWQYTSNYQLEGANGRLDASRWYDNRFEAQKIEIKKDEPKILADGVEFIGDGIPLYSASLAFNPKRTLTGKYYVWSAKAVNKRIRITNRKELVGKAGQITGWVNLSDVEKQFNA